MGIPVTENNIPHPARDGYGSRLTAGLATLARQHGAVLVVMLVCLAWLLPGLFGRAPWKPDEAYTVAVINHFYHGRDWLVPVLGGQPFLEKPPLFYWTAAAFSYLLHPVWPLNEAARFATLFYMLMVLGGVWLMARELYGRRVAHLAPMVLLSCLGFLYRGHELFTDIGLLAGFALAWYGMALALRCPFIGGILLGIGTGVGFMCKGLIAPGVLGLIFIILPLITREYRKRQWWTTAIIALLVCLPWLLIWPILLYLRSPALFHEWFWVNNLGRYLGWNGMGGAFHDRIYYLKELPWMTFPAWLLALYAVWHERRNWRMPAIALPLLSIVVMYLVLQSSHSTNDVYALPLFLPLAVLGANGVATLPKIGARFLYAAAWLLFGVVGALLWCGWLAALTGHPAFLLAYFDRWVPTNTIQLQVWALVVAVCYTAAWLWTGVRASLSGQRALLHWVMGAALVWCLAMSLWLSVLNTSKSYAVVMASLGKAVPAHYNCIVTKGVGDSERGMLDFYDDIATTPSWIKGALQKCQVMLVEGNLDTKSDLAGWNLVWNGSRDDDRSEHFWLLERATLPNAVPLAPIAGGPYVDKPHRHRHHRYGPQIHGKQFPTGNPH